MSYELSYMLLLKPPTLAEEKAWVAGIEKIRCKIKYGSGLGMSDNL